MRIRTTHIAHKQKKSMSGEHNEPDLGAILAAIESDQDDVDNAIVEERNRDMGAVKRDLETLRGACAFERAACL